MDREVSGWWLGVVFGLVISAPVKADGGFLGVGGGVLHSKGPMVLVSAPVYGGIEAHYSFWHNGERDHAVGAGYRFQNDVSPISVMLGVAYIGTITENLLRHEDAYIEIRVDLTREFSCQASHYSTVGDDKRRKFSSLWRPLECVTRLASGRFSAQRSLVVEQRRY